MPRARYKPTPDHIAKLGILQRSLHCKRGHELTSGNAYIGRSRGSQFVGCRTCQRESQRNYKLGNLSKTHAIERRGRLRRKFKTTPEEFDRILRNQGSRCAVCLSEKPDGRGWHIDHDHATGKNRGILCGKCNVALGMANDDPKLLRDLAEYLERWKR